MDTSDFEWGETGPRLQRQTVTTKQKSAGCEDGPTPWLGCVSTGKEQCAVCGVGLEVVAVTPVASHGYAAIQVSHRSAPRHLTQTYVPVIRVLMDCALRARVCRVLDPGLHSS